ncbi:glycosyltransferase [Roseibacillus persicicus]|uniref:glycosyltransferase n=1 Tax=Roseibacillus persicicus TaxID=454148 RepID=UPI00280E933C|nr:glycosyltransferase [Roseibacillus persicicus]MDQ8188865.1 glycosyltransferase [Roseibacillus persicicus]
MEEKVKLLQVFNRYRERGGEEKSAERIFQHGSAVANIEKLWWDSASWDSSDGPSALGQLQRIFYNQDSAKELRQRVSRFEPNGLLCHNLYPIGSPSVYATARKLDLPVLQYIHNFRPFSVGASLWAGNRITEESLHGQFWSEVKSGSWQNSVFKSAIMACVLKNLHCQGWLESIVCWVAISDFMRDKFIEAGIPEEKVVTLRHSWDSGLCEANARKERDYYLFLSRLVPEKGVMCLLDAWAILEKEMGASCPRLLIGGTGSEEEKVMLAAQNSKKIEFVGFVEGVEKTVLIQGCRAMLAPSIWWEPLGLVTYEAYDNCRPMIAAASGGLSETVVPGKTGWLHSPDSAEQLAATILECEEFGPKGRQDYGMAGKSWLKANASPKQWRHDFGSILEKFL